MHVVIVGCGRVGSLLARRLEAEGHGVAVVDRQPRSFVRLGPDFTGTTVAGIGFDRDRLIEAGIEHADGLAAVTSGDNSNIVIARLARETFGVGKVVARIYDPQRAAIYERLGIATVAPALWAGEQFHRRIVADRSSVEWTDPSTGVALVERRLGGRWIGVRLLDIESPDVRVVAVSRLGLATIPSPALVVQEGDVVYLSVTTAALDRLDLVLDSPPPGR